MRRLAHPVARRTLVDASVFHLHVAYVHVADDVTVQRYILADDESGIIKIALAEVLDI